MSQESSKQIFWIDSMPVRYVKFVVDKLREGQGQAGDNKVCQISRLELVRKDGSLFMWPSSTTSTSSGVGQWPSGEWQDKILDHDVYTKMCPNWCTYPTSFIFDVGAANMFNSREFVKWQWWTANDTASYPSRNPVSFQLQYSQNAVSWIVVDKVVDYDPPAVNYSLGYEGAIKI